MGAVTALAYVVHSLLPVLSVLAVCVGIAVLLSNLGLLPDGAREGATFAVKRLLKVGVVLLGFRIAFGDIVLLGGRGLVIVALVVVMTFLGTRWAGGALGLSRGLSTLVATGFAICGNSAIAAMKGVTDADEEEVAYSMALVTVCGSLSIALFPMLRAPLGLEAQSFGAWSGASVHDIGQVIAAASTAGPIALQAAVVVKLTRVMLLAPMVAAVSLTSSRHARGAGSHGSARRPPIVPLFVVGFLGAVAARSIGIVPTDWLSGLARAEGVVLALSLAGLGAGVKLSQRRIIGSKALMLGLLSWVLVASLAYAGVWLTH